MGATKDNPRCNVISVRIDANMQAMVNELVRRSRGTRTAWLLKILREACK